MRSGFIIYVQCNEIKIQCKTENLFAPAEQHIYSRKTDQGFRSSGAVCVALHIALRWRGYFSTSSTRIRDSQKNT